MENQIIYARIDWRDKCYLYDYISKESIEKINRQSDHLMCMNQNGKILITLTFKNNGVSCFDSSLSEEIKGVIYEVSPQIFVAIMKLRHLAAKIEVLNETH